MSDRACRVCHEVPYRDEQARSVCACGRVWTRELGIPGPSGKEALLFQHGFQGAKDATGDVYYVHPSFGHIVWLYTDGTWFSDKAAGGLSLDAYLNQFEVVLQ